MEHEFSTLRLTAFTEEFTSITGELKRAVKMTLEQFFCYYIIEALISHKGKIRRQLLEEILMNKDITQAETWEKKISALNIIELVNQGVMIRNKSQAGLKEKSRDLVNKYN